MCPTLETPERTQTENPRGDTSNAPSGPPSPSPREKNPPLPDFSLLAKPRAPSLPPSLPDSLSLNTAPSPARARQIRPSRPFPATQHAAPHTNTTSALFLSLSLRPPSPLFPGLPCAAASDRAPTHSPPTNQPTGGHGEVHAQEQGLGRGGRHGGRRRAARRPHALPHPSDAAAGLLAAQGGRGPRFGHRGRGLPRAKEQEAREAAAAAAADAGAQGEGRAGRRRRREEGASRRRRVEGTGGGLRSGGGRPRGLLRGQRPGLGRHREEYQGDDALQPDQELGDDKHPWLRDQSQQPFPSRQDDGDAGLPLRSELSRDGRVLCRRRTTATSEFQGEVQLLPRDGLPAPRPLRVGKDRLLGSPQGSASQLISVHQMNDQQPVMNGGARCKLP